MAEYLQGWDGQQSNSHHPQQGAMNLLESQGRHQFLVSDQVDMMEGQTEYGGIDSRGAYNLGLGIEGDEYPSSHMTEESHNPNVDRFNRQNEDPGVNETMERFNGLSGARANRLDPLGFEESQLPIPSLQTPHHLPPPNDGNVRIYPSLSSRSQGHLEDIVVECKHCGAVCKGAHASGNLSRHRKSKACASSNKRKESPCKICAKVYQRSDALLKHMRGIHNAPGPVSRNANGGDA
ncbi:hypothetical protein K504DRAFT_99803 [Pleomassaria siparia CBS 279.74]|uniref:C2H2-type domain-containing protein n=1 Tax=Pleomassaria siparia CBS 279.74 TaxID=1314801 RepID=A0A6G1JXQ4_9PLEO|nr:hypothetical protein K504DRAFT_99803 [Pleomassaria siparia CBS 279.74]